ncbi:Na+/H+ antiporter NhaA [Microbacterium sp. 179-B 1A2 NHS]|uniref:Na+/H+ antiporter NhaA n=1 Tax=Microbacterium sp. 179-B 1A2 NHS TaxID=3142383 RepID=UPI0039A124A8
MSLLRSARFPAMLLLAAAILGLVVANSPLGDGALAAKDAHLGIPGVLTLSVGHWIADGLLAVFFFTAAVELQYELTSGQLNSPRKALQPIIAAAGGVLVPIGVYLVIAGGERTADGWPIPTATDIAFALGVLAVFGRGLPAAVRVFLLALAILDDIVGIVFIAVLFATDVNVLMLGLAVVFLVAFRLLSGQLGGRGQMPIAVALVALAVATWYVVHESGVHATIAGVALGLVMLQQPALRARHALEPWVNAVALPLFAFVAALVVIPQVPATDLSPAFWGVAIALPVGKIVGITAAGWISMRFGGVRLAFGDLLAAGALGGIGFTVSLLMSELAFETDAATRDQAILGVLAGSAVALVVAGMLVSLRAWHYRRLPAATTV